MKSKSILIVDDDVKILRLIQFSLSKEGYNVETAGSGKEALDKVKTFCPVVVLLDVILPDVGGLNVLKQIMAFDESIVVVMISAHATIKSAIRAIKLGAHDFITKPFEIDELLSHIKNVFETRELKDEVKDLRAQLKTRYRFETIVGVSSQMKQVYRAMEKVLNNSVSVLIRGESGTGKEMAARCIHFSGIRKGGPFIDINCAAIPETLLESELFGHEKGVFTGALQRRIGMFEQANGGTIFLDEIGDLTLNMQVKLLRVLQEKAVQRIGSSKKIKVDIRIIAATHRNLEEEVKKKNFREDLYYRLNIFPIYLPPLRDRKGDVPLLVTHFLEKYGKELSKEITKVQPEVIEMVKTYPWPGNVRELENSIERAMVIANGDTLTLEHFPLESKFMDQPREIQVEALIGKPDNGKILPIEEWEKKIFAQALELTSGNISQAAKALNVSRDTLYRKIKKYGLV